ncbi:OFA family MFS transporter [Nocardioides sp. zg-DK7169]|uniref:L-lactate MFS transporter n=1 Tax=Nocardioides sp. zg-DK7169 TaxID=2736600 RepID=UPI001553E15F|nr:OFA family MFS transporter [Nocardioides sp. zg-DK7169]NPC96679.1 OFA family MFS transporter [Nocardioides sp. zg-DK7169]
MSETQDPGARSTDQGQQAPTLNRWWLVGGGLLLQFSIGAVYAWSVFAKAYQDAEPWQLTKVEASLPFTVTIAMIFIGSYLGGRVQDRRGPRVVALAGGVIYAVGIVLASFTRGSEDLWLLIASYGVISGFGLGVAYIVPIAMLQKWFPDKKGLITGLAVGGFGFGAVLTSPVASWLIGMDEDQPSKAFLWLGLAYLVMSLVGASVFRNPPSGYVVPGYEQASAAAGAVAAKDYTEKEALRTPQWYLLTAILTLNVAAGIALISQAAGSAEGLAGYSGGAAATVVGVLAIFNGGGRIVWAAASDSVGRMPAFAAMLALQGVCLIVLPHASNQVLWFVLAAVIYLCYGGGFGTMPATAGDFFGVKNAGGIYGLMLIGWSLGGVLGPILISALFGDGDTPDYTLGYTTIGIIALVSVALTFVTKVPRERRADAATPG